MSEPSPCDEGMSNVELWSSLGRENLVTALKRVARNGGAPGIDGMSVTALRLYLKDNVGDQEALESEL